MSLLQGLSWIGAAVLVVMLPRYLGDINLGRLGFAMACTSLACLVANLGTATYLAKEIARDPSRAGQLTGAALLTRLPLSLVAIVITFAVVNLGGYDPTIKALFYLFSVWISWDPIRNVLHGALQGCIAGRICLLWLGVEHCLRRAGSAPSPRGAGPVRWRPPRGGPGMGLIVLLVISGGTPGALRATDVGWGALLQAASPILSGKRHLSCTGRSTPCSVRDDNNAVVGWYVAAYPLHQHSGLRSL